MPSNYSYTGYHTTYGIHTSDIISCVFVLSRTCDAVTFRLYNRSVETHVIYFSSAGEVKSFGYHIYRAEYSIIALSLAQRTSHVAY